MEPSVYTEERNNKEACMRESYSEIFKGMALREVWLIVIDGREGEE